MSKLDNLITRLEMADMLRITPRSLDRFYMTVTFADGTTATTNEAGDPITINGREIASVTVDTRRLIQRPGRI